MSELARLVDCLEPRLNPGTYAFCTLSQAMPVPGAIGCIREAEGMSVILPRDVAMSLGLKIDFQAEWITLEVQSDLSAVGLTAVVSSALADAGIACNIMAGCRHDHLFVPAGRGYAACEVLVKLQKSYAANVLG